MPRRPNVVAPGRQPERPSPIEAFMPTNQRSFLFDLLLRNQRAIHRPDVVLDYLGPVHAPNAILSLVIKLQCGINRKVARSEIASSEVARLEGTWPHIDISLDEATVEEQVDFYLKTLRLVWSRIQFLPSNAIAPETLEFGTVYKNESIHGPKEQSLDVENLAALMSKPGLPERPARS